jgi:hypothetical protein
MSPPRYGRYLLGSSASTAFNERYLGFEPTRRFGQFTVVVEVIAFENA